MVDVNPESSFSASNSNSMISKTPTSVHTLAGDLPKDELIDTNQAIDIEQVSSCLAVVPGCEYNESRYLIMTLLNVGTPFPLSRL